MYKAKIIVISITIIKFVVLIIFYTLDLKI